MTPSPSKSATSLNMSSSLGAISPKSKFLKISLKHWTVRKPLFSTSNNLKASSTASKSSIWVYERRSYSSSWFISCFPFIKNAISLSEYYFGNAYK